MTDDSTPSTGIAFEDDLASKIYKISVKDSWRKVKIGPNVELGVRREDDLDTSKPNPLSITWTQENVIVVHKRIGMKPLTQCTIPEGLWYCDMELDALDNEMEVLDPIRKMKAGPWMIKTSFMDLCMFIESKAVTQKAGTKDWLQNLKLKFIEANDF